MEVLINRDEALERLNDKLEKYLEERSALLKVVSEHLSTSSRKINKSLKNFISGLGNREYFKKHANEEIASLKSNLIQFLQEYVDYLESDLEEKYTSLIKRVTLSSEESIRFTQKEIDELF